MAGSSKRPGTSATRSRWIFFLRSHVVEVEGHLTPPRFEEGDLALLREFLQLVGPRQESRRQADPREGHGNAWLACVDSGGF